MPTWVSAFWSLVGGFAIPALIALGFIVFVMTTGVDLVGLVAQGAKHLSVVGMNFGSRLIGLVGLAVISLIIVAAFTRIPGAPNVTNFFTAPAIPGAPAQQPSTAGPA